MIGRADAELGYASKSAFSTAFKREVGHRRSATATACAAKHAAAWASAARESEGFPTPP
ncbi:MULTISPECIES: hypothetical protein [unclassified Nonomuraea]|uniref:hypothetical protein n=1 Tax=unclassified Nonomuraea TaxID=2593643 RepID=UPI001376C7FA|nr:MULTISPECIES: hypothetical protein [unclassified Nonomuraea]NBE93081.1 hypothetical protein [Nonomuraea sp. K271]